MTPRPTTPADHLYPLGMWAVALLLLPVLARHAHTLWLHHVYP